MIMYFYLSLDFTLMLMFCELMAKNRQNKYPGLLKTINHSDNERGRTVQDMSSYWKIIKLIKLYSEITLQKKHSASLTPYKKLN